MHGAGQGHTAYEYGDFKRKVYMAAYLIDN